MLNTEYGSASFATDRQIMGLSVGQPQLSAGDSDHLAPAVVMRMMRLTPSRTNAMVMKMMRPTSSHTIHWAALLLCLCLGRHIGTGWYSTSRQDIAINLYILSAFISPVLLDIIWFFLFLPNLIVLNYRWRLKWQG